MEPDTLLIYQAPFDTQLVYTLIWYEYGLPDMSLSLTDVYIYIYGTPPHVPPFFGILIINLEV